MPNVDAFCSLHNYECNKYSFHCCLNVAKASYKTYALVYIFQLITNRKKLQQKYFFFIIKPKKVNFEISLELLKISILHCSRFHDYAKSNVPLSQVYQHWPMYYLNLFLIVSLTIANIMGGLYLGVESKNRQIEIALYCINKTS